MGLWYTDRTVGGVDITGTLGLTASKSSSPPSSILPSSSSSSPASSILTFLLVTGVFKSILLLAVILLEFPIEDGNVPELVAVRAQPEDLGPASAVIKQNGVFWGPRDCYIFLNNIFNPLRLCRTAH